MIEKEYNIVCSMIEGGYLQEAKQRLESILQEDNQYYPALNKLGVIYANQRDYVTAREYFQSVLDIDPSYAPALANLGNLNMEAGDYEQAIDLYRKALEKDADYCLAYYNLAIAYKKIGDYSKYMRFIKEYRRLYSRGLKQNRFSFFKALSRRQT